jgi:hypothetical protein
MPVYETDQCWTFFSKRDRFQDKENLICFYKRFNESSFVVINWLQILIMIFMYYKISKIKDELNIQKEIKNITIAWLAC